MESRYSAAALGRWLSGAKAESQDQPRFGAPVRYSQPEIHWFARFVGGLDVILRRRNGVHEFTAKRTCIFRIALRRAERDVTLDCGRTVHSGDTVVELHLWNEHLLRIPPGGPNFAWAKLMRQRFRSSLYDLAMYLEQNEALFRVVAIRACGVIGREANARKLARICECYGFEIFRRPDEEALGRFVEFWCDIWIFLLVCAFNPRSLSADLLFRPRYEWWMSREALLARFGSFRKARN